jgi:F0F1-type ATP synthase membrane subunit b/b'
MGKFLLGLILGMVLGVAAVAYNPNLLEDARTALANVTALVMRGTERAAEAVGGAADRTAEEAREAAREAEREAPRQPGAAIEEPSPENPPPAAQ